MSNSKFENYFLFTIDIFSGSCSVDNKGRNFVLAFMDSLGDNVVLEIYAATSSSSSVNVIIRSNALDFAGSNLRIPAGSFVKYTVPTDFLLEGTTAISDTALALSSTDDIVVFVVNKDRSACGGYMAIPTDVLGFNYYTISWTPESQSGSRNSQIAIIATEDDTDVTITLPTSSTVRIEYNRRFYRTGDVIELSLNQNQVVQIQDLAFGDLSGTKVSGSNKIAVLTGNKFTDIDNVINVVSEDHLVEQMIPLHSYGKSFILVPSVGDYMEDRVKILASADNTEVVISNQRNLIFANAGDVKTITITELSSLTSDKPILVVQFMQSEKSNRDDSSPSSIIITPVEQFQAGYEFTGTVSDYSSSLVIAIQRQYTDNLIIDGETITTSWQTIPDSDYVTTTIPLENREFHYIYHQDRRQFMANVYSISINVCALAYPAGMCLEDIRPVSNDIYLFDFKIVFILTSVI